MRYHFVATERGTGFGFENIMARPDYTRFRRWYDRSSFFAAPDRAELEAMFSQPERKEAA
jgi:hypothetical protein